MLCIELPIRYEGWVWMSKLKDEEDRPTTLDMSYFRKRKRRYVIVDKTNFCYMHFPGRMDHFKVLNLQNQSALAGFDDQDIAKFIYLIDSSSRELSVVLEPEENVQALGTSITAAIQEKLILATMEAITTDNLSLLSNTLLHCRDALNLLLNQTKNEIGNALHIAVQENSTHCLPMLISIAGDNSILLKNNRKYNLLHIAARCGHLDIIKLLVSIYQRSGSDVKALINSSGYKNRRPLHLCGDDEVTAYLVSQGADVNITDIDGYTPLMRCVMYKSVFAAIELMDVGADVNRACWISGRTALMLAAKSGSDELITELIHRGVNVTFTDNEKRTALHYACMEGYTACCMLLLNAGCEVDAQDCYGSTPLCLAAGGSNSIAAAELVAQLLLRGAYPKIRDMYGRLALHYAAEAGNESVFPLLFRASISVNDVDYNGTTALEICSTKHAQAFRFINSASDADPDANVPCNSSREYEIYAQCITALKSAGAVNRVLRSVPVEPNARDVTFMSSPSGGYSVASASPWAIITRLTTFPFYNKTTTMMLLTTYKLWCNKKHLLLLLKLRFHIINCNFAEFLSMYDNTCESLGVIMLEPRLILLRLLQLEVCESAEYPLRSRMMRTLSANDSNIYVSPSSPSSPAATNRRRSITASASTVSEGSAKMFVKGIDTQFRIKNGELHIRNSVLCKGAYSDVNTAVLDLLKALGIIMKLECHIMFMKLIHADSISILSNMQLAKHFNNESDWSLVISSQESGSAVADRAHTLLAIEMHCKTISKIVRNKNCVELKCRYGLSTIDTSPDSLAISSLCEDFAKVLYFVAHHTVVEEISQSRKESLSKIEFSITFRDKADENGENGKANDHAKELHLLPSGLWMMREVELQAYMDANNISLRHTSSATTSSSFSRAADGERSNSATITRLTRQMSTLSDKAESMSNDIIATDLNITSLRGLIQVIIVWITNFYEDDFSEENVKNQMSDLIVMLFEQNGDVIASEFDVNAFAPFLSQSAIQFALMAAVSSSSTSPSPVHECETAIPVTRQRAKPKPRMSTVALKRISVVPHTPPPRRGTFISIREPSVAIELTPGGINYHYDILRVDPQVLAEQITLLEHNLFCRVKCSEFLKKSTNYEALQAFSIHMMNWYISYLLRDAETVAQKISYLLEVSQWMQNIHNYNGMFEILTVLQTTSIYRLKSHWIKLDLPTMDRLSTLKQLYNSSNNFSTFRQYIKENKVAGPCMPYLGIYIKDIVSLSQLENEVRPGS